MSLFTLKENKNVLFRNYKQKNIKKDFLSRTSKEQKLKRTSLFSLMSKKSKASATVEALLLIPSAFLFFMAIVWIMALYYIHAEIGQIVYKSGYTAVMYSPISGETYMGNSDQNNAILSIPELVEGFTVSQILIRRKIDESRAAPFIDNLYVTFDRSDNDREISITAKYRVKPFIEIPGFKGYVLTNSFYSKTYKGYLSENKDRKRVYVTKNSQVYHTNIDCRALKNSARAVLVKDIDKKRNEDNGKYYPCKKCFRNGVSKVYVTDYGIKYHADKNCKDIKTNVYAVWDCDVEGRRECYFCR